MKKTLLLTAFVMAANFVTAQPQQQEAEQKKEKQSILERLINDDEILNIFLDTRMDAKFSTGNPDGNNFKFEDHTLRISLEGQIIPGIRYRVKHRLNRSQEPLRDNLSRATDHAWIAFDFGRQKQWTITAGKQSVQFGTFEYDYSTADVYLVTMCFNDLDAYKTGINVAYRFLGQQINLQIINSDAPQFASEEYKNKSVAANFLWEGNLFDGTLKTRWGYGLFMHDKSKYYNWITPGVQLNLNRFTSELDYYFGYRSMDYGTDVRNEDLGLRYVKDQSLSLNLKYNFGIWRPSVKGTWNQRNDKVLKQTAYESFGVQGALEVYPFKHKRVKDLRFHAVYHYNNTDLKGPYSSISGRKGNTIILGMRWLFKAM